MWFNQGSIISIQALKVLHESLPAVNFVHPKDGSLYYTLIMEAKPTECLFQFLSFDDNSTAWSVLTLCLHVSLDQHNDRQLFFVFYPRKSSREATGGESDGGGGQT